MSASAIAASAAQNTNKKLQFHVHFHVHHELHGEQVLCGHSIIIFNFTRTPANAKVSAFANAQLSFALHAQHNMNRKLHPQHFQLLACPEHERSDCKEYFVHIKMYKMLHKQQNSHLDVQLDAHLDAQLDAQLDVQLDVQLDALLDARWMLSWILSWMLWASASAILICFLFSPSPINIAHVLCEHERSEGESLHLHGLRHIIQSCMICCKCSSPSTKSFAA